MSTYQIEARQYNKEKLKELKGKSDKSIVYLVIQNSSVITGKNKKKLKDFNMINLFDLVDTYHTNNKLQNALFQYR